MTVSNLELRYLADVPVTAQEGNRKLSGYAIVWNSLSQDLGGFVEKILKG